MLAASQCTLFAAISVMLALPQMVNSHARLMEPPSRSSMWRVGFNAPANYNDNGLNCGGKYNQHILQGGRCGICGDPYQGPRENEAGGRYATGIIVRKYTKGQTIEVAVDVTANHLGWFEFKLCPNNNIQRPATQKCLDSHVLQLADGNGTKYFIGSWEGRYKVTVKLPDDVTCSQCVFQWRWHAGNSAGVDPDGRSCLGCGMQEEFYGCADVEIAHVVGSVPSPPPVNSTPATRAAASTRSVKPPTILPKPFKPTA